MVNCLVTGVGSLIGQGIIRCLRASSLDCRITGTDYFDHAVGLYWLDQGYILPDLLSSDVIEEQWVKRVLEIIEKEKIDVVLIGLDFEVEAFARHKTEIERDTKAKVIVGTSQQVDICKDKWKTVRFLKEEALPFPESCLPQERDTFLATQEYPLIVKPRFGFRSRDLFLVQNREELEIALDKCPSPIIQEQVGKIDEEYTCGCLYLNDEVVSTIALKRFLKDGNTSRALFTEDCLDLDPFIAKVANKLKLFGPINLQLRKSQRGPVIFEINPRFSGTTPVRALFGKNEVEILIKRIVLNQTPVLTQPKPGVVLRYFEDQFVSMEQYQQWGQK